MEWDTRPLPAGWIPGYDEETERMCYFQYNTSPPTVSFVHPLDVATDMEVASSSSPQNPARPLPSPPGASDTQSQEVASTMSPQSYNQDSPPLPFPSYAQGAVLQGVSPPPKLTPAQQLYARSLTKQNVAVSTVPAPSLRPEHSILRRENGGGWQSLYKSSVASYTGQVPPLKAQVNPLRSSKAPQMHVFNPSEPTSAPPYSEINTIGEGGAYNNEFERSRPNSLPAYTRDQADSEAHFRQPYAQSWDPMTRNNHDRYVAQPRSLHPLNYQPIDAMRPREPKKIITAAKPPSPQHQLQGFGFLTSDPMVSSGFPQPRPSISSLSQTYLPPPTVTNTYSHSHLPIPSSVPPPVPSLHNVYQASNLQSHVHVQPQNIPISPSLQSSLYQPQSVSPKSQPILNPNNGNIKPTKPKKPYKILGNFKAINNALGRKSFDLGSSQNKPPPQLQLQPQSQPQSPQPEPQLQLQSQSFQPYPLPPRPPVPLITTIEEGPRDSQESDRELIESLAIDFSCLTNGGDTRSYSISDEPPSAGAVSTSEALGFTGDPSLWSYDHSLLFQHLSVPTIPTRPSSVARSTSGTETDNGTERPYNTSFISFN